MIINAEVIEQIAQCLRDKGSRICTAESCTGGLIAKSFTDLAGSSDWFERGFVTYSNEAKNEMLAVPTSVIQDYGAVSEAVAVAMIFDFLPDSFEYFVYPILHSLQI